MADPAVKLTLAEARIAWFVRQRIGPVSPAASPTTSPTAPPLADLVGAIGWCPIPVGPTPYLALLARGAITRRAEVNEATFQRGELAVVPGPRGSTWLVPAPDGPLARAFAVADHASREARVASACVLNSHDLKSAREALRAALETPTTPEELRLALSERVMRPLGEVGRRAGSATLAGLVLRGMWILGEVIRVPVEGRLDRDRFRYVLDPRPRVVPTAAEAVDLIAGRWLAAHGPTTAKVFAAAFGIATGRALAALKPLKAVPVAIEGLGESFLAPAGFEAPPPEGDGHPPRVAFLPLRDPLLDAHPGLAGLATPAVARAAALRNYGSAPSVVVDGEIVGTWAYDEVGRTVVWRALVGLAPEVTARIDEAAQPLARFLAEELGTAALHATQAPRRLAPLPGEIGMEF